MAKVCENALRALAAAFIVGLLALSREHRRRAAIRSGSASDWR
jgi:hypothetical protein